MNEFTVELERTRDFLQVHDKLNWNNKTRPNQPDAWIACDRDLQVVDAKLESSIWREASNLSNEGQKCAIILKTGSSPLAGDEIVPVNWPNSTPIL